jgi:hypothetical protein
MFSRYRIKEVQGKFLPQVWCFGWESIDRRSNYIWYSEENQLTWCAWGTLEQARERINKYRGYKKDVKYHKV